MLRHFPDGKLGFAAESSRGLVVKGRTCFEDVWLSRGITGSGWISGVFGWISGVGLELWVCPRPNGGGEEHPSRSPFCALNIFRAQNGLREGCSSPPPLGRGQTHNSSPTPEIQPNTPEIQPDPVIPLDNQTSSKQVLPLTTSPREDSAAKPNFPSGKWRSIFYPSQPISPPHQPTDKNVGWV